MSKLTLAARWRWNAAQHARADRHAENAATNRLRDAAVARGELCPTCYQRRQQPGLAHGGGWRACGHQFHDGGCDGPHLRG
jgi:hypothetical protein